MIDAFHQRIMAQGTRFLTLAPLSRRRRSSKTMAMEVGPIEFQNQNTSDVGFSPGETPLCL